MPATTPAVPKAPAGKAIGPVTEVVVFLAFVLVRAFHPVVIDSSKTLDEETGKKAFAYQKSSVNVAMTLIMGVFTLLLCYAAGGKAQFATVWKPAPMLVFSINGVVYALGDYLEMASMGGLDGVAYQLLQQSRIVLTAVMMICAKGVYQTRLQWILLTILMFAMSAYMVISTGGKKKASSGGGFPLLGMTFAFLKVIISCVGAVVSDKYMKVYKDDPTHVSIARIYVSRSVAIVLLSFTEPVWSVGFFSGWDTMTYCVTISFIVKSVSTLYIVALLDSIMKNIAESFAVLVIYTYDVAAPWVNKSFDVATFLAVLVVVAACAAYIDSKAPIDKAKKYDKLMESQGQ